MSDRPQWYDDLLRSLGAELEDEATLARQARDVLTIVRFEGDPQVLDAPIVRIVAYDLGDGFWRIVGEDGRAGRRWQERVPADRAEERFIELQREWLIHGCACLRPHRECEALDREAPWLLRDLAACFRGYDSLETALTFAGNPLFHDVPRQHLRRLLATSRVTTIWDNAVDHPLGDTNPPGLNDLDGTAAFDAWLGVPLRWSDTGDPLDRDTAHALRLACQYLAIDEQLA